MKRKIFICVVSVSALLNAIPLLIFMDNAEISIYSLLPIFALLCALIVGIAAYVERYKGNFLYYPRPRRIRLSEPPKYDARVFTKEYQNEFFWQFCVYWFVIPFYIPCIFFFSENWVCALWLLGLVLAPFLVYFVYHVYVMIKSEKDYKLRKQRREQELKEQMLREELGHFK